MFSVAVMCRRVAVCLVVPGLCALALAPTVMSSYADCIWSCVRNEGCNQPNTIYCPDCFHVYVSSVPPNKIYNPGTAEINNTVDELGGGRNLSG